MECNHFFKLVSISTWFHNKVSEYTYGCTRCDKRMNFFRRS